MWTGEKLDMTTDRGMNHECIKSDLIVLLFLFVTQRLSEIIISLPSLISFSLSFSLYECERAMNAIIAYHSLS